MNSCFPAVALALLLLCFPMQTSAAAADPPPSLRVVVQSPHPPFSFLDENGNLTGFDVDIAMALCRQIKRQCLVSSMPFDDIIPALMAGEADMAVANMGATPEREARVSFSDHYVRSHSIFIEKPGTVNGTSKEELRGKRVGVKKGTLQELHLQTYYRDAITLAPADDFLSVATALKNGSVDLILVEGLSGYEFLRSEEGAGLETIGDPVRSDIILDSSHIAVAKNAPELLKAVNAALKDILRSGEYGRINRKYFDFPVY